MAVSGVWAKVQPLAGIFTDVETGELVMNLEYDTQVSRKEWLWFLREWAGIFKTIRVEAPVCLEMCSMAVRMGGYRCMGAWLDCRGDSVT